MSVRCSLEISLEQFLQESVQGTCIGRSGTSSRIDELSICKHGFL